MPTSVQRPLAFFKEDPANLRKGYDPEEMRLLAASLVKKQLVPLICRPCGTFIDGHRRYRAAMLDGRPTHLDTVIVEGDVTDAQVKEIQLYKVRTDSSRADFFRRKHEVQSGDFDDQDSTVFGGGN